MGIRLSNYTKKQLKKMDRHIAQMLVLCVLKILIKRKEGSYRE